MSDFLGSGWSFPPRLDRHGGVALASAEEDIEQSMGVILGTAIGERVMRPTFGSRLHELVFAPLNSHTFGLAEMYVEEALGFWEPRIQVLDVEARVPAQSQDDFEKEGVMLIEILYRIKATHDERSLVYPFYWLPGE